MKLSTKKMLGVAASGVVFSGAFLSPAMGATYTWSTTGSGNSQSWTTPTNWTPNGQPGSGDTAFFNVNPPSNTVSVSSPQSVGAILDEETSSNGTLSISGSALTLVGQSLSITQEGTATPFSNVVLAMGSSTANENTLTVGDNITLQNSTNVMVAAQGNQNGSSAPFFNQQLNVSGNVSNGTGTSSLTLFGGGNISQYGGVFNFTGTDSFTGGITIGNTSGTQGGTGEFTAGALPTTGNITVNEQSQLLLDGGSTYGVATQTLFLNGGGIGPGDSNGSSGALRNSAAGNFIFLPALVVGTNTTGTAAPGFVVITAAKATGTINLEGAISGTTSLQKQGGGVLIFNNSSNNWSGGVQIGNGTIETTATTSLGSGSVSFAQTSTNSTTVDLLNPTQSIQNLSSSFVGLSSGSDTQVLSLNGTALTINATGNNTFGYGAVSGLTSTIADGTSGHGSVIYNGVHRATLTLTGPNTYSGGTTINGGTLNLANVSSAVGSALGSGNVTVNSGGELSSGGGQLQFQTSQSGTNPIVTSGYLSGNLTVNSGGIVAPGGDGLAGTLSVGGAVSTPNNGADFNFDLAGGTSATASELLVNDGLDLASGSDTVNITGSKLAVGTYTLATFGSLLNYTSGTSFVVGTTPGGVGRTYSLSATGSSGSAGSLVLTIASTQTQYTYSVGGGDNPAVDGNGTWQAGSTNFFTTTGTQSFSGQAYNNSSNDPVIIGSGGAGGTITVSGAVTAGGGLIFSNVTQGYTVAGTNTITLSGGIVDSATETNAPSALTTTISAPIVLTGSQNFQASANNVLALTGGISDGNNGYTLSVGGDTGTVLLGGTNTYSGGTVINTGVLESSTGSLPSSGGVQINNTSASLVFNQASSGSYSGLISGSGSVAVNSTATVSLTNIANSYSGPTDVEGGVLAINNPGDINSGSGGINMLGGTLQFTSPVTFGTGTESMTLNPGTTSTIDTEGNNVTLGFNLTGSGGNLTKIGTGTLTFDNLQPTRTIGVLSVLGGALDLSSNSAFSFTAPSTPGGFTGDLIFDGAVGIRLFGGNINGGGSVYINGAAVSITGEGGPTSEIDNTIVLNSNELTSFAAEIGANSGNTLVIGGAITGDGDVDFTGGAGLVMLEGQSTYDGPTPGGGSTTTIDNSSGGEVQLDVNNALPTTTNVHLNNNGYLDVYGVTQTIGSLDSGAAGTMAIVSDNSTNNALLVIDGTKSTNFAGYITDNSDTPNGGGMLAIELGSTYTGTLNLNSTTNNNYSGGTILNGGTLELGTAGDALLGNAPGGVTFGGGTLLLNSSWSSSRPLTVNPTVPTGGSSTISAAGNPVVLTPTGLTWSGGTLNLVDAPASSITTSNSTVVSVTAAGSALSVDANTTLSVSGPVDPFAVHTTTIVPAADATALINAGTISITGGTTTNGVQGEPTVSIAGVTGTGTLDVGNGNKSVLQLAQGSGGSAVNSLVINANATLDITNNHLIINYAAAGQSQSTIDSSIYQMLKNGFNGGGWNGVNLGGGSIISTSAQTPTNGLKYGVGWADGSDGVHDVAGLSSGQFEIKYTLLGDANLDGTVNGTDFSILAANFGLGVTNWDQGNFLYSSSVNGSDFSALAANFGQGDNGADTSITPADIAALDAFAVANGLALPTIAAVPEPASVGLVALGAVGMLSRRRRKQ